MEARTMEYNATASTATEAQFLAFYEQTVDELHRYATRLTAGDVPAAQDLVQDAYLQLVVAIKRERLRRFDTGWLIVAIRHRFLDNIRSRSREAGRLRRGAPPSAPSATATNGFGSRTEVALAQVSDMQRLALVLRYIDDLPVVEVARSIGRSVHATESLLARGRTELRRLLSIEGADDD